MVQSINCKANLLLPWGKADKAGNNWEPAILHMVTVGIVADEIYRSLPSRLRQRIANGFGLEEKALADILTIIVSLHDLGKISVGHQLLRDDLTSIPQLKALGFSFEKNRDFNHKQVAFSYIKQALEHIAGCPAGDGSNAYIAYALAAHHGELQAVDTDRIREDEQWDNLRISAAEYLASVFEHEKSQQIKVKSLSALLLLSGITILADWIGSSGELFPYALAGDDDDMGTFLSCRREKVRHAISTLGLDARLKEESAFDSVFDGKTPNAAQQSAFKVAALLTHPMLLIVLSSTGSGKTEIPLGLFAETAIQTDLRGLYFALPTQGTANQNFQRLKNFADKLHFEGNPQIHLLHSAAAMDDTYNRLKARIDDGSNSESGTVTASEWFSTTKKGLAGTFGGGTIDQALLSVLRVKWMPLRFFALAGKMVVFDEIHSYDTYMTRAINRFLEWAPYIETSVVALSATLPQKAVKELLKSFSPEAELPEVIPYPCILGVDTTGKVAFEPIPVDDFKSHASLSPLIIDSQNPLKVIVHKIEELIAKSGNIAIIMNTIGEAQDLAALIQQSDTLRDIELIVYHSRFTVADRAAIDKKIRSKYGKDGFVDGQRPHRSIVVATQVLEQSLDVDFDFMISWLAPIDLLLQRLGRLQRFCKKFPRSTERTLYVVMTDILPSKILFGLSGLVYFPDILDKTARLFVSNETYQSIHLNLPEAASPLIEAVYGERNDAAITKWEKDRIGKQLGEIYLAETSLLDHAHGEEGFETDPAYINTCLRDATDEARISSRLADVSVTVILLSPGDELSIKIGDVGYVLNLWGKSLPVRHRGLVKELLEVAPPPEWQNIPLLRNSRPLYLDRGMTLGRYKITYDNLGLHINKTVKGE